MSVSGRLCAVRAAPDAEFFTPLGTFGAFAGNFRPSSQNLVARVSYSGNLGRHLSYTDNLNDARYAPGASTGNI